MTTEGVAFKLDKEKPRWDLVPTEALNELVKLYTLGAAKYTEDFPLSLESGLSKLAKELTEFADYVVMNLVTPRGYVDLVMRKNYEPKIQSTLKDSDKIVKNGNWLIRTDSKKLVEEDVLYTGKETLVQSIWQNLKSLVSQKNKISLPAKGIANFVDELYKEESLTLTTIIRQGEQEDTYVLNVTTDSDFLTTVQNFYKKQLTIYKPRHIFHGWSEHQSGVRNWEKGMTWGRIFSALMRHAWKWWKGETYDQEDGQHHMIAVAWCALALFTYENSKLGSDDRVKQ